MDRKTYRTRSDCTKKNARRYHYTRKKGSWKAKMPFETEQDALAFIKKYKMDKYVAYICPECNKWHIGSSALLNKVEK